MLTKIVKALIANAVLAVLVLTLSFVFATPAFSTHSVSADFIEEEGPGDGGDGGDGGGSTKITVYSAGNLTPGTNICNCPVTEGNCVCARTVQ